MSPTLWDHTLDGMICRLQHATLLLFRFYIVFVLFSIAAIKRDGNAREALERATRATANINCKASGSSKGKGKTKNRGSPSARQAMRDAATAAVKASIQASPCALFVVCGVIARKRVC